MKQRRKNESPEVSQLIDKLDQPLSGGSTDPTPVYDQHYGEPDIEAEAMKSLEGESNVQEGEDDSVCVVVDNELYCMEKEEFEGKKKTKKKEE